MAVKIHPPPPRFPNAAWVAFSPVTVQRDSYWEQMWMCSKVTLIIGQGQQDRACSSEICSVCVFLVIFFCLPNLVHLHVFTSLCHPHCPSLLVTLLNLEAGTLSWWLAASSSNPGLMHLTSGCAVTCPWAVHLSEVFCPSCSDSHSLLCQGFLQTVCYG